MALLWSLFHGPSFVWFLSKIWEVLNQVHISHFISCVLKFSSVTKSCPTLCNCMDCSTPGFPVLHQLPELAQTHVHWVGDAIQLSHPLSSPSPSAFNVSHNQGIHRDTLSLRPLGKNPFDSLVFASGVPGSTWCFLAYRCSTTTSVSVVTWHSPCGLLSLSLL